MKTYDLEYIDTGLFTRFIPNTPEGESAWRTMDENGGACVFTLHADKAIAQLRKAGYSVKRAKKQPPLTACQIDNLLAELGA